ncbi:MAG: type II toxin-antitoxin system mRNA interferase toxin, RelE/StbE family [Anaerolineae bacterium CG17_big_fil_post_rev_8_21_14_2_50_57_27]|nr:MAG: type II toxin-antitoxin system mRNA interferase toxin, RelE/StbE family [Anaerolineae bacterium CG17_big_fil_post_rev_8_21_14_2_50_57_27]
MKTLVWSTTFVRAFTRSTKRDPALKERAEDTLRQLAENPFYPPLHSHKLKGELAGLWACTVDYDNRILFEFVRNQDTGEEEIFLLTIGTHDEVY